MIIINMSLLEHACFIVGCQCDKLHINRPKFDTLCTGGVKCYNANCWFTHPPDRAMPKLIDDLCKNGVNCKWSKCRYIHPERKKSTYVERKVQRCKYGKNCPRADKCKRPGHDLEPVRCPFGGCCRNKNAENELKCLLDHSKIQSKCPHGTKCKRAEYCWFAEH